MISRLFVAVMSSILLASCASVPDKIEGSFDLSGREHLYEKKSWFFSGRMSLVDENHAVSANIEWSHEIEEERIALTGSFGLGRTRVVLTGSSVKIDLDGRQVRRVGNVDDILSKELGIAVPVSALKYWVLGIADPGADYRKSEHGFVQHDWRVSYLQMQSSGDYELPRKIRVEQGKAKLKLIVSRWDI